MVGYARITLSETQRCQSEQSPYLDWRISLNAGDIRFSTLCLLISQLNWCSSVEHVGWWLVGDAATDAGPGRLLVWCLGHG